MTKFLQIWWVSSYRFALIAFMLLVKLMKHATSPDHVSMLQIGAVLEQFETNIGVAFLCCTQQCRPVILRNYTETSICWNFHLLYIIKQSQWIPTASSALTSAPWLMSSRTKCIFPLVAARMRAVLPFYRKKIICQIKFNGSNTMNTRTTQEEFFFA